WKHFAHLLMSQAASQLGQTQPDLRGCYCRTPFDKRTSRRTNLFGIVIFVSLDARLRNELKLTLLESANAAQFLSKDRGPTSSVTRSTIDKPGADQTRGTRMCTHQCAAVNFVHSNNGD